MAGLGVGDFLLRFAVVSGVGLGDGVGELLFRFGEPVGDGLGANFFTADFRCFRAGVGVGVGSRIFLIFVPNDSSALARATIVPKQIATIRKLRRIILVAGNKSTREFLKNRFVQANTAFEIFEGEILVRRMRATIGQPESHQECLDTEDTAELGDNRDAATFANYRDIRVERLAQCALGRAFASLRISSPSCSGMRRNVSFAIAWLAITVFVPFP